MNCKWKSRARPKGLHFCLSVSKKSRDGIRVVVLEASYKRFLEE
jgi:hypothetical protein